MTTSPILERLPVYLVEDVGDGDTVTVLAELALDTFRRLPIRLSIVNAPELDSSDPEIRERAVVSSLFASDWLAERAGYLALELEKTRTGRYRMTFARYLASIYDTRTGDSLSSALLERGLAVVWKA